MAGYYYGQLSKEKKAVYDMLAAPVRPLLFPVCDPRSICG